MVSWSNKNHFCLPSLQKAFGGRSPFSNSFPFSRLRLPSHCCSVRTDLAAHSPLSHRRFAIRKSQLCLQCLQSRRYQRPRGTEARDEATLQQICCMSRLGAILHLHCSLQAPLMPRLCPLPGDQESRQIMAVPPTEW